jgi:hypothetical protein
MGSLRIKGKRRKSRGFVVLDEAEANRPLPRGQRGMVVDDAGVQVGTVGPGRPPFRPAPRPPLGAILAGRSGEPDRNGDALSPEALAKLEAAVMIIDGKEYAIVDRGARMIGKRAAMERFAELARQRGVSVRVAAPKEESK